MVNSLVKSLSEAEQYVNTINCKLSCKVATNASGTLSSDFESGDTVDDIVLSAGDRILIKDQGDGSENGIYVVNTTGAPTRSTDMDSDETCRPNSFVFIEEGTTNADKMFQLTTNGDIIIDNTSLTFAEYGGASGGVTSITSGDGISGTDTTGDITLSLDVDDITLEINASGEASAKTGSVTNGATTLATGDQIYDYVTNNTVLLTTNQTVAGSKTFSDSMIINDNLTINSSNTTINSDDLIIKDPLIKIADGNSTDNVDIGFYGEHNSKYSGLIRNPTDGEWYLFKDSTDNPPDSSNLEPANLNSNLDGGVIIKVTAKVNLVKGNVVYIHSDTDNDTTYVDKADASDTSKMPSFGLALKDIDANNSGFVITMGNIINVSITDVVESGITLSNGDVCYISANESGKITNVPPSGESNRIQNIGKVIRLHNSNVTLRVGGAGRTNATPALNNGNIFMGDSNNNSISKSFNTALTDENVVFTTSTQTLTNKTLTSAILNGSVSGTAILDEDNMSSNSATSLATQQSIKAYADTKDISLASVANNYLSISGQEITAGNIPISLGGTGATSPSAARTALGVDVSGTDNSTPVTLANTNYLSLSGQEITGGTIPVSSGGTGSTSATAARTALGLTIGSDIQAYDIELNALAGLTSASNKIPMFNGSGTATTIDFKDEDDMASDSATAVASQQSVKAYVDSVAQGLNIKTSCKAATITSDNLSSGFEDGDTIDGVTLSTGDRILIKDQSDARENGIYVVKASGAPDRSDDMSAGDTASGDFTFVTEGNVNGDHGFVCTSNSGSDTIGTDNLSFTQFSGAGQITAGDGLEKSGNTLSIDAKSNSGIVIDTSELSLDLGASSITGTLAVSDGGTGATTAAGARTNLGVDAAGTDNSTPVTLANTNYLSLSGQEITGGTIPISSGGTGSTTAAGARTALGVDASGTDNSTPVTLANTNYLSLSGQEITGGTIPISSGGTGATSPSAARTALDVDQSGTDNSTPVTLANTNYLSLSGQEITGGTIPISSGGTGSTTAAGARTNLGLVIGTDVQAHDAGLTSIAGLTTVTDNMIYTTGSDTYATASLTSFARTLLDDSDASAARTTLGAGTVTSVGGTGSVNGLSLSGSVTGSGNLSLGGTLAINDSDWSGTDLSVANGGTGASSFTSNAVLTGNGTSAIQSESNLTFDGSTLNVNGSLTISGHIIPNASNTYDLGSADNYFRDLYLSGSTIRLGNTKITTNSDGDIEFMDKNNTTRRKLMVDELIIGSGDDKVTLRKDSSNKLEIKTRGSDDAISDNNIEINSGGTGATTASGARTNLGLVIGTDVQAHDAGLTSIASLTTAADNMIYTTGSDTYATTSLTSFARTLLDDSDASAARSTLDVDQSGTDNSTPVTLANTNYLSISGQEITGGTIPISSGGTGATTASDARTNLGAGTVTSVGGTGSVNGLSLSGSVTSSGNLTLGGTLEINDSDWSGDSLSVANGGTGASTASEARTNLGLVIGTDVQAHDAGLTSIAGLTTVTDNMIYTTGSDTYATASLTSFARTLLDDSDASAARTTLGAGTVTSVGGTGSVNGLSLSGSVTSSGNLTLGGTLTINDSDWSGASLSVANGGTGQTTYSNGELLIGNNSNTLTKTTLTQGNNISITNGDGSITIAGNYSIGDGGLTEKNFTTTLKTKLDNIAASANNYSLPSAADGTRGGVQIGYNASGQNYPVELDSEKMFVNVPWTDNDTIYSAGNGIDLNGTTFSVAGGDGLTQESLGLKITPAQTTITSIYNSSLKIGTATDQEYISFSTSDEVNTFVNNTERLSVKNYGVDITGNLAITGTITCDTSLTIDSTTISTSEIGVLNGVTAGTASASKALVLDSNKDIGTIRNLTIDGIFTDGNYTFDTNGNVSGLGTLGCGAITSSGNLAVTGTITGDTSLTLDSTTITTAEIGVLNGVTAGIASASKALVLNASGNISGLGNISCGDVTMSKLILSDVTSGKILIGDGTSYEEVEMSGDATIASTGTLTIANDSVTLSKMAGLARGKIIVGDSSGNPSSLTIGSANTVLKSNGSDASWGNVTNDMLAGSISSNKLDSNIKQLCIGYKSEGASGLTNFTFTTTPQTRITVSSFTVPQGFTKIKGRIQTGILSGYTSTVLYCRFKFTRLSGSSGAYSDFLGNCDRLWIAQLTSSSGGWDRHRNIIESHETTLVAGQSYKVDGEFWRSGGSHYTMYYGPGGASTGDWPPLVMEIFAGRDDEGS